MKMASRLLAVMMLLSALVFASAPAASARESRILTFQTMVGLPPTLTGAQSVGPLRAVSGGGLPWKLTSASGFLTASGHLKVEVEGLVFAAGPNTGANTVPFFRALVSCVQADGTFSNILTDPFPATLGAATAGGGNADIETDVVLPTPCIAPIIFVTSPGGAWFAATGN